MRALARISKVQALVSKGMSGHTLPSPVSSPFRISDPWYIESIDYLTSWKERQFVQLLTMMDLQKKRVQLLLFIVGLVVLSITAEKCRLMVGESASSRSGQFTFLNCFDMGTGSMACSVKDGIKLYVYNLRSSRIERARARAIELSLADALSQGLDTKVAAQQAQKEGKRAAKLATQQTKRIIGPIISSAWDFSEVIYFGGTVTEGLLMGTGTLFGAYSGGFIGEQRLGKLGYLAGSHLGSWVGGRIGLMVYDVVNGVHYLFQFTESIVQSEESSFEQTPTYDNSEVSEDSYAYETPHKKFEESEYF